jgi:hypothetical protein
MPFKSLIPRVTTSEGSSIAAVSHVLFSRQTTCHSDVVTEGIHYLDAIEVTTGPHQLPGLVSKNIRSSYGTVALVVAPMCFAKDDINWREGVYRLFDRWNPMDNPPAPSQLPRSAPRPWGSVLVVACTQDPASALSHVFSVLPSGIAEGVEDVSPIS